ncbi:peptidylprolyl isomerase, partial [bacterium]|nr:peptidylprolyl isomerase [bacterium]
MTPRFVRWLLLVFVAGAIPSLARAAPTVTVWDVTMPAGHTFQMPLDGDSPEASPLAYELVSISDTNITAELTSGNRSLSLLVMGKDADTNDFSGELVLQLYEDLASNTTARIISLVESNFYDGLTFHRITDDFLAQGGDPNGDGSGGSGVLFDDEYNRRLTFNGFGQLAMATTGNDSNDSQLIITDVDLGLSTGEPPPPQQLTFQQTIFGQLTSGFAVFDQLIHTPVAGDVPSFPPVISNAVVFTDSEDAVLRVTAPTNFTGAATITVRVTDTNAVSTDASFTVTVITNAVNLRPFLGPLPPSLVATQYVDLNVPLPVVDFETDLLTVLVGSPGDLYTPPAHVTAVYDPLTQSLQFTPDPNYTGDVAVVIGVRDQTDHDGNSIVEELSEYDTQPLTLTIVENDTVPSLTVRDITMPAGQTFQVPLDGSSPIGLALAYEIVSISDLNITAELTSGNRSLRLLVSGKDAETNDFSGELVLQLYEDLASNTTARIISLVESNFYDGLTFHRTVDDFVAQGGDPDGDGSGGSGVLFNDEYDRRLTFNGFGQLAMANAGDDSNDSQLFITDVDLGLGAGDPDPPLYLSFQHTVFGQLTRGFAVFDKLIRTPAAGATPLFPPVITSALIITDTEDAVLRVTAPTNFTGAATITVRATDTNGVPTEATFTVTVVTNTVNLRPFLGPLPASLVATQYVVLSVPLPAVDVEGESLTVLVGSPGDLYTPPAHVTAVYNPLTQLLQCAVDPNYTGDVAVVIGVRDQTDHDGNSIVEELSEYDTQHLTLTIVPNETGPSLTVRDITVPAGQTFQVPLDGYSPVGSPLNFALVAVSDFNLLVQFTTGNRSLRLLVSGKDAETNDF